MKNKFTLSALAALLPLQITAHFLLISPPSRGFNDDMIATFPCGGFDAVQVNRTLFPINNAQIALEMADDKADIEVLIGMGNDVGTGFSQVIRKTFAQNGTGNFCMTGFNLPVGMVGMNATIQVVTSNEDGGGLYNCADVTLTMANMIMSDACVNGTGITTGPSEIVGNPNNTAPSGASGGHTHKARSVVQGRTGGHARRLAFSS